MMTCAHCGATMVQDPAQSDDYTCLDCMVIWTRGPDGEWSVDRIGWNPPIPQPRRLDNQAGLIIRQHG